MSDQHTIDPGLTKEQIGALADELHARNEVAAAARKGKRWFQRLDTWEQVGFAILAFGVIALLVWVSKITLAYAVGKAGHALAVLFYGLTGGFVGFLLAWAFNRIPSIRERAVPAADDSMWGINQWRCYRKQNPDAPWSIQDAVTTLAACLRFGLSYLGVTALAAVGMFLA